MPEIQAYNPSLHSDWDRFVAESRNGTFLHMRGFMDYHADRFPDCSLIIRKEGRIRALLPASFSQTTVSSHAGLTYGGLLLANDTGTAETLAIFRELTDYYASKGFEELIYKPVPHIYHKYPAEEDLYALFRMNAGVSVRNVSACLQPFSSLPFKTLRKRGMHKADKAGVSIAEDNDLSGFWSVLENTLRLRHNTTPVHSLHEISLLAGRFPENIRLFTARTDNFISAGILMFVTDTVAHAQYIATTPQGRENGSLDLLVHHLVSNVFQTKKWFDFGISNENRGLFLNEGLISQKEGFGARAVCYDTYSIDLRHG